VTLRPAAALRRTGVSLYALEAPGTDSEPVPSTVQSTAHDALTRAPPLRITGCLVAAASVSLGAMAGAVIAGGAAPGPGTGAGGGSGAVEPLSADQSNCTLIEEPAIVGSGVPASQLTTKR